jgi:hypothetical protein
MLSSRSGSLYIPLWDPLFCQLTQMTERDTPNLQSFGTYVNRISVDYILYKREVGATGEAETSGIRFVNRKEWSADGLPFEEKWITDWRSKTCD